VARGRTLLLLLPALLPQSLRAQLRSASRCPYGERQYPAQTMAASRTRYYRRRACTVVGAERITGDITPDQYVIVWAKKRNRAMRY
jgi:hypothetical protein